MSLVLPGGSVSVPSEQNVSVSASGLVRVRCLTGVQARITVGGVDWYLSGFAFSGGARRVDITEPDGTTHTVESFTDPSFPAPWSQWYDFTVAWGPYREGRVLELIPGATSPHYGQVAVQETESWFSDAATTIVSSLGAYTHTQTFSDPPASVGPVIGILEWHSISSIPFPGQYPLVQWQSMSLTDWDAATLLQLDDGTVRGTGSGKAELYQGFGNNARFCAPAYNVTYDGEINKYATAAPDWAQFVDRFWCQGVGALSAISFPAKNGSFTHQNVNWPLGPPYHQGFGQFSPGSLGTGVYLSFELQSAWMAAQDPPLEPGDRFVGIRGPCGLDPPSSPTTYQPVGLKVLASVDLHRPDGNKPSAWVTLDAGLGTVADGATNVVFTVTGADASFIRSLFSAWRGRADYRDVRHHAAEDVFWAATYGWLKLTLASSVDAVVYLTARGVHFEQGPNTEHAFSLIYPISVTSGTHDYYVDLIAGSGVESYPTRVDAWLFDFTTPGTYTLSAMSLVARTDLASPSGHVYAKTLPTVPEGFADCNMVVLSLDGASVLCCLPPLTSPKANESIPEDFGGAPLHIISDMLLLKDYVLESGPQYGLGKIEGVDVPTYSLAAYEGANKDAYGNILGPENADWLIPNPPYDLIAAGTTWQPQVAPLVARWRITNRSSYTARVRWSLWGALEAVAISGSARAAAGSSVPIYRDDTGALVGTGTCDNQGFAVIAPVPANSALVLRGAP